MYCLNCQSSMISWELDSGKIVIEYDDEGKQVNLHTEIDSLTQPVCNSCGSTKLAYEE